MARVKPSTNKRESAALQSRGNLIMTIEEEELLQEVEEVEVEVEELLIVAINAISWDIRSFECPNNEEARHRGAHIAQSEEEDINLQIMENVPETGEALVMRKVLLKPIKEADEPAQRKALFRTVCKVQGKCCKVIIDGGSTDNLVSTAVIEKLNLQKTRHPIPYKVS